MAQTVNAGSSATIMLGMGQTVQITAQPNCDGTISEAIVDPSAGKTSDPQRRLEGRMLAVGPLIFSKNFGPYDNGASLTVTCRANGPITVADVVVQGGTVPVAAGISRPLTAADNNQIIECTAPVTLTVPVGLPSGFSCVVIPSGTTTVASDGTAMLNGATTSVTRAASSNAMFAIQARVSAANSFVVTGS